MASGNCEFPDLEAPKETRHEEEPLHRGTDRRHSQRAGSGTRATELARKHGVHANTIRKWRDRYGGLETSDLVPLKHLDGENAQMQRIIARQALEIDAMKTVFSKNDFGPDLQVRRRMIR